MKDAWESQYPLTVPQPTYEAVCDACGQFFADCYLFGATISDGKLLPRTLIGWQRMTDTSLFIEVLKGLGLTMVRPEPWSPRTHRTAAAIIADHMKAKRQDERAQQQREVRPRRDIDD